MLIKYQVFISSTYKDLIDEREQIIKATLEMGHIPVGMEMFSAADEEQWKIITKQIDQSDYYVVILAHNYGSVVDGVSFTEKEYDYAVQSGVPVIGFVLNDSAPWPGAKMEPDEGKRVALESFKAKVKRKPVGFWNAASDLHGKFSIALTKLIASNERPGWARATSVAGPEVMAEMSRLSSENASLRKQLEATQNKTGEEKSQSRNQLVQTLSNSKISVYIWKNGGDKWSDPIESTLFRLFSLIAPELVVEKSSENIAQLVALTFNEGKLVRPTWPIPMNVVNSWMADLLVLGLVQPSTKKHPIQDKNDYWTLSDEGRELHAALRRIQLERRARESPKPEEPETTTPKAPPAKRKKKPTSKEAETTG